MGKHNNRNKHREPKQNHEPDLVALLHGEEPTPEPEVVELPTAEATVATETEETPEVAPTPEPTMTPEQLLTVYLEEGIPDNFARLISKIEKAEEREPLLVEARKLIVDAEHGKAKAKARAFQPFNEAVKARLPQFLSDIATEFGVDLKGRKLVIDYPPTAILTEEGQWGNPAVSSLVSRSKAGGNGGGKSGGGFGKVFTADSGQKMGYQSVSYRENGKVESFSSLSALAIAKGSKREWSS